MDNRALEMTAFLRRAALALGLAMLAPAAAWAQSVVFINPGKSDEVYWVTASSAMQAAARNLGMRLEVRYTQRDHTRAVEIAREVAGRPAANKPEFAIIVNEHGTGLGQMRELDAAGIRIVFAFSSPLATERVQTGGPREKFKGWLGSIEPRAEDAGYLTAQALIARGRKSAARGPDGKIHFVALAGDRTTTTSIRRNEGMLRAVAEARDVVLDQTVYAAWTREKAAEQSEWLYTRHPHARLVWAGNDLMAFGAIATWEKRGGKPGQDAFFSGVNTSSEAMEAVRSGRLSALAGGHFICGAWAMVMIHDYAHGSDFATEALEFDRPMFALFDAASAQRFETRFGAGFDGVDFSRYSKARNQKLRKYDFEFGQLLR